MKIRPWLTALKGNTLQIATIEVLDTDGNITMVKEVTPAIAKLLSEAVIKVREDDFRQDALLDFHINDQR